MYRHFLLICLLLGIGTPLSAQAAIEISEVAWMGGVSSPNHEWIELANTGATAVVVDDWTLADGSNLLITLSGSIPAGAHVVLERTSDDSAPGAAFLVYTGALVNTGATLTLRQNDGQIADQVVGGSDWGTIGGDNATKATAQRIGSTWRTGTPTPGRANAAETGNNPPAVDDQDTTSRASSTNPATGTVTPARRRSASGDTIPLRQATTELILTVDMPTVAYERQVVTMRVVPSGVGRTITESLNYQWNFGDFTTATGSMVTHRFTHPGMYLVTVRGQYGRHDVVALQSITVLPMTLSITRTDEYVLLNNDAVYDIDVSGFRLVAGAETMTFPPYSYVAAKQSVRLPVMSESLVIVRDGKGAVVVREMSLPTVHAGADVVAPLPLIETTFERTGSINTAPRTEETMLARAAIEGTSTDEVLREETGTTARGMSLPGTPPSRWPYLLLGLLLIGVTSAVVWPRAGTSPSDSAER